MLAIGDHTQHRRLSCTSDVRSIGVRKPHQKRKTPIRPRPIAAELRRALLNNKAMSHCVTPVDYVSQVAVGVRLTPMNCVVLFVQPRADGLHVLRHSSGSIVYARTGGDVETTQEWLGHSRSRVTLETDLHPLADQQRKRLLNW